MALIFGCLAPGTGREASVLSFDDFVIAIPEM
jgi:hypothetical protein